MTVRSVTVRGASTDHNSSVSVPPGGGPRPGSAASRQCTRPSQHWHVNNDRISYSTGRGLVEFSQEFVPVYHSFNIPKVCITYDSSGLSLVESPYHLIQLSYCSGHLLVIAQGWKNFAQTSCRPQNFPQLSDIHARYIISVRHALSIHWKKASAICKYAGV